MLTNYKTTDGNSSKFNKESTTANLNNFKVHIDTACRIVKEGKKESWQKYVNNTLIKHLFKHNNQEKGYIKYTI